MPLVFITYLSSDGQLGWSHFLAFVTRAAGSMAEGVMTAEWNALGNVMGEGGIAMFYGIFSLAFEQSHLISVGTPHLQIKIHCFS